MLLTSRYILLKNPKFIIGNMTTTSTNKHNSAPAIIQLGQTVKASKTQTTEQVTEPPQLKFFCFCFYLARDNGTGDLYSYDSLQYLLNTEH